MSFSYHDSVDEKGATLDLYEEKATDQESVILEFLRLHPGVGYTPFEILEKYPNPKPPITSVRRAITNLEHKHKDQPFGVRKSTTKRKGEYGRDNFVWFYLPELRQTKLFG
jgi:hypothetical protein